MSDCKLVPVKPTPAMVEAAEDAYMPFGDMDLAIRMAILATPAVQQSAPDIAALVEPPTELCDEIDKYDTRTAITETDIHWFKRKARMALAAYRNMGEV